MIILNEKEYAEDCLKNNTISSKPFFTLSILAKYYYHHCGFKKKKITELLTEHINKTYPRYSSNRAMWDESIEKIAANAKKYTLYEINEIYITESEIQTIENIHNKVLERLAFTILCIAKLNNKRKPQNNGWVNLEAKEIFSLARISCSVESRYEKLGKLYDLSLLELPKRNDNLSFRVTFMDNDSPNKLKISDFRELGYEYLKYKGESFTRCEECGILIRQNKNKTKKYCNICSKNGHVKKPKSKMIICVDCGKKFEIPSNVANKIRCDTCQYEHNKLNKKIWESKNRK